MRAFVFLMGLCFAFGAQASTQVLQKDSAWFGIVQGEEATVLYKAMLVKPVKKPGKLVKIIQQNDFQIQCEAKPMRCPGCFESICLTTVRASAANVQDPNFIEASFYGREGADLYTALNIPTINPMTKEFLSADEHFRITCVKSVAGFEPFAPSGGPSCQIFMRQ